MVYEFKPVPNATIWPGKSLITKYIIYVCLRLDLSNASYNNIQLKQNDLATQSIIKLMA